MKKKIGIIDVGFGNIASVINAIRFLKYDYKVIKRSSELRLLTHLILPGVGSFNKAAKKLQKNGWHPEIKKFVNEGKPLLGICMGMQLLFEEGTEHGTAKGLGLFKGRCEIFKKDKKYPLPHVGFNLVKHNNTSIWNGIANYSPFYFIHSYRVLPNKEKIKVGLTSYGEKFISFIEKNNIFGAQFHPEKSHRAGLALLQNFVEK
jgi:glutamine amidotransferase